MLENFKPYNLTIGLPAVSFTANGITFNKSAVTKIGKPSHVIFYINELDKQIAIVPCAKDDENATQFYKPNARNVVSVRWNNKDLLNTIYSMMDWNLDTDNYKSNGNYYSKENVMIFDLKEVVPITTIE